MTTTELEKRMKLNQKIAFAIYSAAEVYHDAPWTKWANGWLTGKDRSANAAHAASHASHAAYDATYAAALLASRIAAHAAYDAAHAAYDARAAYAAARAAYDAAYAGRTAARAGRAINFSAIIDKIRGRR